MRDNVPGHDSAAIRKAASATLRRSAAGIVGTAILLAACGPAATTGPGPTSAGSSIGDTGPGTSGGGGASIDTNESDFKIDLSATTATPGSVTFHVRNTGAQVHEFVVIKTDTAGDQMPQASGGTEVEEESTGLTVVDEIEDIAAGASADLDVTLDAGHYVLICNVPGHYQLGMHTDFTVAP
jgi:uncharacterized cupredoxin-like copper-binding protein